MKYVWRFDHCADTISLKMVCEMMVRIGFSNYAIVNSNGELCCVKGGQRQR